LDGDYFYLFVQNNMFYTLLLAVLPLLMLQIHWTGFYFLYTVRLDRDGWDEGEA